MAEIWDIEDEVNQGGVPVCERLYARPEPYFRRVFRNEQYDVLEVLDETLTSHENKATKTSKAVR